jgi:hypothetical protein
MNLPGDRILMRVMRRSLPLQKIHWRIGRQIRNPTKGTFSSDQGLFRLPRASYWESYCLVL